MQMEKALNFTRKIQRFLLMDECPRDEVIRVQFFWLPKQAAMRGAE